MPESHAAATPSAPTATMIPASSATATSPERENPGIQGPEPSLTDSNTTVTVTTGIDNATHNLAPTSNEPSAPLATIGNTEAAGQSQPLVKRAKGLAVVGTGLTDKYIGYCIS
jgi:hypothetical protein